MSLIFAFANFTQSITAYTELRNAITNLPVPDPVQASRQLIATSGVIAFSLLGAVLGTGYFLTKKVIVIRLSQKYKLEQQARQQAKTKTESTDNIDTPNSPNNSNTLTDTPNTTNSNHE